MFGPAFTTPPFSVAKFAAYLLGLAMIAGLSLAPVGPRPLPAAAVGPDFEIIRFVKSQDEIEDQWAEIGIPWFLRNAGVVSEAKGDVPHQLSFELRWQGQALGRIIEKTETISADRTRLYLAFVPDDMDLVRRLAAPIDTSLDPVGLVRATLVEHVRSRLDGDDFNLEILQPDSLLAKLKRLGGAGGDVRHPLTDDVPPVAADPGAAAIDQAYKDEARLAGSNAPNL